MRPLLSPAPRDATLLLRAAGSRDHACAQLRRQILVPLGLAALGETKLPVARDCAGAFDADVLLLHVMPTKSRVGAAVQSAEAAALAYLDTVVAYLHAAGISARCLVRCGPVAATIVREAREQSADLIILGAPVQPALVRAVIGSVADAVVHSAPCPVLLVQPALEAGTGTPLRSFAESAARAGALTRRPPARQTVEVSRIIGSVGRVHELAADFRPPRRARRHGDEQRLARIRTAMERGQALPPVELYQLGFGYYVLDGHHRVAAARLQGQLALDANVVRFIPAVAVDAAHTDAAAAGFAGLTGSNSHSHRAHKHNSSVTHIDHDTVRCQQQNRDHARRPHMPRITRSSPHRTARFAAGSRFSSRTL
jgi:nucleotide-binding universal stress UspA family protein